MLSRENNKVVEFPVEINHAKKRVRQLIIGSVHLSKVLSYGRTLSIKERLGSEGKERRKNLVN